MQHFKLQLQLISVENPIDYERVKIDDKKIIKKRGKATRIRACT